MISCSFFESSSTSPSMALINNFSCIFYIAKSFFCPYGTCTDFPVNASIMDACLEFKAWCLLWLYFTAVWCAFKAYLAAFVTYYIVGSANILRRSAGCLAIGLGGFALSVVLLSTFRVGVYCSASLNRFSENCRLPFLYGSIGICR